MLELYSTLSLEMVLPLLMFLVLGVILQVVYLAWLQESNTLKFFEVLVCLQLIIFALILSTMNQGFQNLLIIFKPYYLLRWLLGGAIFAVGLYTFWLSKAPHLLLSVLLVILTLPLLEKLPYGVHTVFFLAASLLLPGRAYLLCYSGRKRIETRITEFSIKEAFDQQHNGIMFSEAGGNIILINHQMLSLMLLLTGREHRNAELFWSQINNSGKEQFILELPIGGFWRFSRTSFRLKNKTVYQTIATDVTEVESINRELQYKHRELENQQEQLNETLKNIEKLRRQEVINHYWNHVHDVLGQQLSAIQRLLRTEPFIDRDSLAQYIEELQVSLKVAATLEGSPEKDYRDLTKSFSELGIKIHREGELPSEEGAAQVLVKIIREALINAVRHGQAENVYISIAPEREEIMTITNDGLPPLGPILWGGGLRGIQIRAKSQGWDLQVECEPKFRLVIRKFGGEGIYG